MKISYSPPELIHKILHWCLIGSFVFMGMGQPIFGEGGKFSLSNLIQIITVFILTLFGFIKVKDLLGIFILLILIFFSLFNILIIYGVIGKILVVFFVTISLLYCIGAFRYLKENVTYNNFLSIISTSIHIVLPLYIIIGLYEFLIEDQIFIAWGMDDKAHAAIILCFFSFLSISYLKKFWFIYTLIFFTFSLFTVSRLPVIFFPFLMLALLRRIYENKGLKIFIGVGIVVIIVMIFMIFILFEFSEYFLLINRVSSIDAVAEEGSTNAHLLLIEKAIELKFQNIGNFIFGISPGSFDIVLLKSGIPINDIASIDYAFIEGARIGKSPMHSTHGAIFCEYPLVVFILYVFFLIKTIYQLWSYKLYYDLMFWLGLLLSITFYSAHNKFYFYVIIFYIYSVIWFKKYK